MHSEDSTDTDSLGAGDVDSRCQGSSGAITPSDSSPPERGCPPGTVRGMLGWEELSGDNSK